MFGQMFQKKTQTTTPEAARLEELLYYAVQQQQPMIVFTPQGEIVNANPLFLAAVGYAEPEIVGRHHRMFCAPEYARSRDYQQFWQKLSRGEAQAGTFSRFKNMATPLRWKRIISLYLKIIKFAG